MTVEDIKRLNYIKYSSFRDFVKCSRSIVSCFFSFFIRIPWHMLHWKKGGNYVNEIFVVVPSLNNQKSVRTILDNLSKEKCCVWGSDMSLRLPRTKIELLSITIYLPIFLKLYFSSSKEDKKLIRDFFRDFITTCATYKVLDKILINNPQLKMVIMANDHVLITRCLVELTEKYHIKSLYVQHASVTEKFPPLRFDYSFLDGQESFEKYQKIGNMRGKVFLSGSPRFDDFFHIENKKIYDIGVALNALDSIENVLELCLYLKENYSEKIIVRPHPAMFKGLFDEKLFLKHGIAVSNPTKDLSYVFISDIKVMIANESSIHLDAALMGVPSILYNFSDNDVVDWYSYLKNRLIIKCDSYKEVLEKLKSSHCAPIDVVRYYAASYNTPVNGKIGEMIANFINKMLFVSPSEGNKYIESIMVWQEDHYGYRLYS